MIDTVRDPNHGALLLHTWDGQKSATSAAVQHQGITYLPGWVGNGLVQAVRFPTTSKSVDSPAKLILAIKAFLSRYMDLERQHLDLLLAFVLASWFVDCFQIAPVLSLLGPENEVGLILRLLGCLCFRPVLLGDLDFAALRTLPDHLRATLLIHQRNLDRRVKRVLIASNNRHFRVARGKRVMSIYGARAFYSDSRTPDDAGLSLSIYPAQRPTPPLTDLEEHEIADDFQARLLAYRMVHHGRVREAQLDGYKFSSADQMRTWLAPIVGFPELRKSVLELLAERSADLAGSRFYDAKCLVAEAALMFCHRKGTEHFFVAEATEKVNDLLLGRHADFTLEDRKGGFIAA